MKIGIVGGGAMGTLFAFMLGEAGNDIAIFEGNDETRGVLAGGIDVEFGGKTETRSFRASNDPEILSDRETVIVMVKAYDAEAAARAVSGSLPDGIVIASFMNGLGAADPFKRAFPAATIIEGTTSAGASRRPPRTVAINGTGHSSLGGDDVEANLRLRDALERAGLPARVCADPRAAVWEKALVNAALNPLATLARVPNGAVAREPDLRETAFALIDEGCLIAQALGIAAIPEELKTRLVEICEGTAENECSMLQDILARRPTEIDYLNGKLADYAEAAGLRAPLHTLMTRLVRALERS